MKIEKTTRIYIAGAGGMLGQAVHSRLSAIADVKATDIDINEAWLSYADVRDHAGMAESIREYRPHAIFNLAALTDLEYCERNPDNAWRTNALGAENVGLLANELDVPFVHISTAGIFDGSQESFDDYDIPNPLCVYARSKYAGEQWVVRTVRKHFVTRAGWMMGGGLRKDKKFVKKVYAQLAAGKRVLHVVDDKLGTPTYTHDFAHGLQLLLESDLYGLYNQVCEGAGSRYEVAVEMVRQLGLDGEVEVVRVDSTYYAEEYFAPRPASEKLLCSKLRARGLYVMRDWRECLAEYLREFPNLAP